VSGARWGRSLRALLVAAAVLATPVVVAGQGTLERSPNVEGAWAPRTGVVQINFMHRFQVVGTTNKVLSSPAFLVAAGVPGNVVVGSRYAPNSVLVSGHPNEWEVFGRWVPLREERGWPVDLGVQVGRNGPAGSVDGEVLVGRSLGPVTLLAGGRAYSAFRGGDADGAVVLGTVVRLGRHVAIAGDVADVLGGGGEGVAWSGGLQLGIPYTPHTLSLHASNVNATTLQSASLGSDDRRYGFEFTVPITLSRYLGGSGRAGRVAAQPGVADPDPGSPGPGPVGAVVDMDNMMRFLPDTVRIAVGESVRWVNGSDIVHTVTADPSAAELPESVRLPPGARPFDSGDMRPGEEFVHVFTEPGEYRYFCLPHERAGMVGVVIVE
jgi:plastocyanin